MTTVGRWLFSVQTDGDEVRTEWQVWSDEEEDMTVSDHGITEGPLHAAIFDAYDSLGIICPFVLDPHLLALGGHQELREEAP